MSHASHTRELTESPPRPQGIVHRDLKPENFLFENHLNESALKIIDFGFARFQADVDKLMMSTRCVSQVPSWLDLNMANQLQRGTILRPAPAGPSSSVAPLLLPLQMAVSGPFTTRAPSSWSPSTAEVATCGPLVSSPTFSSADTRPSAGKMTRPRLASSAAASGCVTLGSPSTPAPPCFRACPWLCPSLSAF